MTRNIFVRVSAVGRRWIYGCTSNFPLRYYRPLEISYSTDEDKNCKYYLFSEVIGFLTLIFNLYAFACIDVYMYMYVWLTVQLHRLHIHICIAVYSRKIYLLQLTSSTRCRSWSRHIIAQNLTGLLSFFHSFNQSYLGTEIIEEASMI